MALSTNRIVASSLLGFAASTGAVALLFHAQPPAVATASGAAAVPIQPAAASPAKASGTAKAAAATAAAKAPVVQAAPAQPPASQAS